MAALGQRKGGPETMTGQGRSPTAKVTAVLLLLVSVIISNITFFNLLGNRILFGSAGFIFWSDLLLLIASYMELLPSALRQIRRESGGNLLPGVAGSTGTVTLDSM